MKILKKQKDILKPAGNDIDLRKLGFNMYVLIINLLTGNTYKNFFDENFKDLRNALSHSASSVVRNRVNQTDFEEELRLTKKMLEACGIMTEETLLWSIINS